jgi:hypothetical protein
MRPYPGALGASRILLVFLRILNFGTGVGLLVALPATFFFEPVFFEFFSRQPPRIDPAMLVPTLRVWMVLAFAMVAAVHVFLSRLLAVLETVRAGDPFLPPNARRLRTIAWCALGIELLHLAFGVMAKTMNAAGSNVPWEFSLNGWLAVVLLFVLARIFEEGTRMRADLEGMV